MNLVTNPWVAQLEAYIPGEQPREPGFIKLNTNESPYPPAPEVLDAVRKAAAEALFNKYPDPASSSLRAALARGAGVPASQVLVGNGSDEALRLVCHAFLSAAAGDRIGMVHPTYSLYKTIAAMFGCASQSFDPAPPGFDIPEAALAADVRILFIANPNPPIGVRFPNEQLSALAAADPGRLLVIDEAYVDFADADALDVYRAHSNHPPSSSIAARRAFSSSRVPTVMRTPSARAGSPK